MKRAAYNKNLYAALSVFLSDSLLSLIYQVSIIIIVEIFGNLTALKAF
jgi:hypothetical protein